jgi:excisionase family DNA binding protein
VVTLDSLQAALEQLTAEVRQLKASIPTQLVDIKTAAEFLGVSTRTVRRLVAEEQIAYRKVGRHVRFDLARLAPRP